jgi:hypothetical protein
MNQPRLFKNLLLGLPIGIFLLGGGSLLFHVKGQGKKTSEEERDAGANRRDVNEKDLRLFVKRLSADIGPRHMGNPDSIRKTLSFLEGTLGQNNIGFKKVERLAFPVGEKEGINLQVSLTGSRNPQDILVIGAHYDTVAQTPGANDNGSGCAALLGIAQAMVGTKTERTVRFVFFGNEEPPYFQTDQMGSYAYARKSKASGENIVGMISLETMGYYTDAPNSQKTPVVLKPFYPDQGNFLAFVGYIKSEGFLTPAKKRFESLSSLPCESVCLPPVIPQLGWSDHWSFQEHGYPAFMVTDTAEFRYQHYHLPTDTADQLNYPKFTEAVTGLARLVQELANPAETRQRQKDRK